MTDRLSLRQTPAPKPARQPLPPPPPKPAEGGGSIFSRIGAAAARQIDEARELLKVRREAELVLNDASPNQPTGKGDYRHITKDAYDVNDALGRQDAEAAAAQVKRNAPLEASRIEGLSADDKARYERVAKQVENDPAARLSLQMTLLEGKLTREKADDGKSLLETLDGLGSQDMDPQIDRAAMMSELVREIATPSAINQHNRGTCTVTSLQILMAMERPAEYARVVGQLAGPEGEATLASGDKIRREPGTETDDGTGRSIPSRLWQPSLMEYANGKQGYDNKTGKHDDGSEGLDADEIGKAMDAVMDQEVDTQKATGGFTGWLGSIAPGHTTPGRLADRVRDEVKDNPVMVGLKWGEPDADGKIHGGHKVLVTKIEDDKVYYNNPWGTEESMSFGEFEDRLKNANFAEA